MAEQIGILQGFSKPTPGKPDCILIGETLEVKGSWLVIPDNLKNFTKALQRGTKVAYGQKKVGKDNTLVFIRDAAVPAPGKYVQRETGAVGKSFGAGDPVQKSIEHQSFADHAAKAIQVLAGTLTTPEQVAAAWEVVYTKMVEVAGTTEGTEEAAPVEEEPQLA